MFQELSSPLKYGSTPRHEAESQSVDGASQETSASR